MAFTRKQRAAAMKNLRKARAALSRRRPLRRRKRRSR